MKAISSWTFVVTLLAPSVLLVAQESRQTTSAEVAPEGSAETAAPSGVPADVADLVGIVGTADGANAVATSQAPDGEPTLDATAVAGGKYIYTTLRVAVNGGSCGHADWNCMTNQCRSQLGSGAWRGWAGCWKKDGEFICYFECNAARDTF